MAETIIQSLSVWKRQDRNWRVISSRSMLNRFFQRLTDAYSSLYILELGANPFQLGMVNSFSQVAGTLTSVPFGWLQDRFSLRRIFLAGVGLSVGVSLVYALATGWVMIIPALLLSALALKVGSCLTICDVSVKSEDRSTCKGVCDGLFAAPSIAAPMLAALVVTYYGGIGVEGIRPFYWVQLLAGIALLLLLARGLTEIKRPKASQSNGFAGDYREVFQRGTALKRYMVFSATNAFSTNMTAVFTQPFAYEVKGADQFTLGAMLTSGLLVQIVFSASLGNMADRVGRKRMIYLTEPLYFASVLLLVFSPSLYLLILSSLLGGFRLIIGYISVTPLMVERVPISCIGRWRGIVGLTDGLASIPAPIIGGFIWQSIGPTYLILIPLIVEICIVIPLIATIPEKEST